MVMSVVDTFNQFIADYNFSDKFEDVKNQLTKVFLTLEVASNKVESKELPDIWNPKKRLKLTLLKELKNNQDMINDERVSLFLKKIDACESSFSSILEVINKKGIPKREHIAELIENFLMMQLVVDKFFISDTPNERFFLKTSKELYFDSQDSADIKNMITNVNKLSQKFENRYTTTLNDIIGYKQKMNSNLRIFPSKDLRNLSAHDYFVDLARHSDELVNAFFVDIPIVKNISKFLMYAYLKKGFDKKKFYAYLKFGFQNESPFILDELDEKFNENETAGIEYAIEKAISLNLISNNNIFRQILYDDVNTSIKETIERLNGNNAEYIKARFEILLATYNSYIKTAQMPKLHNYYSHFLFPKKQFYNYIKDIDTKLNAKPSLKEFFEAKAKYIQSRDIADLAGQSNDFINDVLRYIDFGDDYISTIKNHYRHIKLGRYVNKIKDFARRIKEGSKAAFVGLVATAMITVTMVYGFVPMALAFNIGGIASLTVPQLLLTTSDSDNSSLFEKIFNEFYTTFKDYRIFIIHHMMFLELIRLYYPKRLESEYEGLRISILGKASSQFYESLKFGETKLRNLTDYMMLADSKNFQSIYFDKIKSKK